MKNLIQYLSVSIFLFSPIIAMDEIENVSELEKKIGHLNLSDEKKSAKDTKNEREKSLMEIGEYTKKSIKNLKILYGDTVKLSKLSNELSQEEITEEQREKKAQELVEILEQDRKKELKETTFFMPDFQHSLLPEEEKSEKETIFLRLKDTRIDEKENLLTTFILFADCLPDFKNSKNTSPPLLFLHLKQFVRKCFMKNLKFYSQEIQERFDKPYEDELFDLPKLYNLLVKDLRKWEDEEFSYRRELQSFNRLYSSNLSLLQFFFGNEDKIPYEALLDRIKNSSIRVEKGKEGEWKITFKTLTLSSLGLILPLENVKTYPPIMRIIIPGVQNRLREFVIDFQIIYEFVMILSDFIYKENFKGNHKFL